MGAVDVHNGLRTNNPNRIEAANGTSHAMQNLVVVAPTIDGRFRNIGIEHTVHDTQEAEGH